MIPASINSLYEKLTEEDKNLVLDYLQFLVSRGNIKKVKKNENLFSDIDAILADDKGWKSEEEMLHEMSEFRKKRVIS